MSDDTEHNDPSGETWHGGSGYHLPPEPSAWILDHLDFLEAVIPRIAIDIGCFEGRHLGLLRQLVGDTGTLIGTDIDPGTFAVIPAHLNARLITAPLDRSIAVVAGCEGLADIGLFHRVLHNIHEPGALAGALEGLAALMRPDGRLLVSARTHDGPGIARRSTVNPNGTERTDLYFGKAAFSELFRPWFEVAFIETFDEDEFYEGVHVVNTYLGAGLVRRDV